VVAGVQDVLETVETSPERVWHCDIALINSLQLGKAFGLDGIPNGCLSHVLGISLVLITHYSTVAYGHNIFRCLGRKRK